MSGRYRGLVRAASHQSGRFSYQNRDESWVTVFLMIFLGLSPPT